MSENEVKATANAVATIAPGPQQTLQPVPIVVVTPSCDEVMDMMAEETRFAADAQVQDAAAALLAAGYTAKSVARKLGIKASTLLCWVHDERFARAFEAGVAKRRQILHESLQDAAGRAVMALSTIASDSTVAAQHRVKASEAILDRCGLVQPPKSEQTTAAIAVNIDFDERLAQIVARNVKV
tara:strand:+ start:579 stop:1127 length:549 start_codon:yes stop_codon:yes gene_type:complete